MHAIDEVTKLWSAHKWLWQVIAQINLWPDPLMRETDEVLLWRTCDPLMCEVDEVLLKLLIKAPLRLGKCTDVCRVQWLGQAIRVDLVGKKDFFLNQFLKHMIRCAMWKLFTI